MKDQNNIDDIFRSGLEDFEMNPPDESWNVLDEELTKKRAGMKRRNRFWPPLIVLLVLIINLSTNFQLKNRDGFLLKNNKQISVPKIISKNENIKSIDQTNAQAPGTISEPNKYNLITKENNTIITTQKNETVEASLKHESSKIRIPEKHSSVQNLFPVSILTTNNSALPPAFVL